MGGTLNWGWYPEEKKWVKLRVDEDGSFHVVGYIDELDDIGDVNVPAPADDDILYWDDAAGKWQDIAHLGVAAAHHAAFTPADHTAIGDAAPHHAQAHTLASHTTKAHAELTGVTADLHHNQAHTLASHTTKAHAELSDAPENAHHTKFTTVEHTAIGDGAPHHAKYTDAEAKAAAVQAGAITNAVTKAPTHDAVFDVKATADAALPAVDKYTDAEAKAQAEGAKLDDHAAPDDNLDLNATAAKHGLMPKASVTKLAGIAVGADVTGANPPQAHKDSHDPIDGGDKLDTAIPVTVAAANAIGSSHSLSRADHVHEREHAKYTDAAAKAAAVQAGAITDGVTKAPTHDAVYDVKTMAEGHKDRHDPEDGADPLDTAAPVKVGAANAIGSSHSLSRADHVHEREHAIYTHPQPPPCRAATGAQTGHATAAQITKLNGIATGADVTGANPPQAHKDSHDPIDGGDKLDTAAPVKVGAANAIGSSHSLSRADHVHEREHAKYTNAEAVTAVKADASLPVATITFIIDGGGSAITTGIKGDLEIPFACTINRVTMLASQSGSIVVDIWKQAYADFPPENANSITAAAPPTITTDTDSQDSTLSGWTTAIAAGDCLRFNVDSITDIERVTISLKVTKT